MRKEHPDKEKGSIGYIILIIVMLVFTLTVTFASGIMKQLGTQRSTLQGKMETALKDAVLESVSSPLFQGGVPDPNVIQNSITQVFAQKLQIPAGNVAIQNFTIYSDADNGSPAPAGIQGTIPGKSIYVELQVTWTTPSVMGISHTGTYPVKTLIALPTFYAPGQTWN